MYKLTLWSIFAVLLLALAGCSKDESTPVGPVANDQPQKKVEAPPTSYWSESDVAEWATVEPYIKTYPPPAKKGRLGKTLQDEPIVTNGGFEEADPVTGSHFAGWTTAVKGPIVSGFQTPGGFLIDENGMKVWHPEWGWYAGASDPYKAYYLPPHTVVAYYHEEPLANSRSYGAGALQNFATYHELYQDINLPTEGDLNLEFWIRWKNYYGSWETSNPQNIIVTLRDPSDNSVLRTLFKASDVPGLPMFSGENGSGSANEAFYVRRSSVICDSQHPLANETVRLHFEIDGIRRPLLVDLDDIQVVVITALTVNAPPDVTGYTGPNATECNAFVSDATLGTATSSPPGATITRSEVPPGNVFPVGTTTIIYTGTDAQGHTATATQVVTVKDNTAPRITAPAAVIAYTGPGATTCGAVVNNLGEATASDNCSVVSVIPSGVPLDNFFPVGTTAITYTATDAAGNTATATQVVTVKDNTPPTITAPAAVTVPTGANATACEAAVTDEMLGTVIVNDNCPGVTLSRIPSGNLFPKGTTTITYTATDAAGNTTTATQDVTVIDNTPPRITVPLAVTTYTGSGATTCELVVSDAMLGTASAQDNCDGTVPVIRSGVPSGNLFPKGTTTITYATTDLAGNTASAIQTVTVIDNTPPVINSVTATPNTLWPPNHKLVTVTVNVGASDNCGSVTSRIINVTSNEPDNGLGDGDTTDDIQNIIGLTVQLRAERSGKGSGRTYAITVQCTDEHGNHAEETVEVTVPSDKGKKK
jgi:hypothetical protein